MLLNAGTLNSVEVNGLENRTRLGSASISCAAAALAAAFIITPASCISHASAAFSPFTSSLYELDYVSAQISCDATVNLTANIYVRKESYSNISVNAEVNSSASNYHDSLISALAEATIIAFQGDGAKPIGNATVQADAELGKDTHVSASCSAATSSTVILHAYGDGVISGTATVDVVPSMQYAGDTFYTHDGHTRLQCSGDIDITSDPLQKIAFIENGGFIGECNTVSYGTVAHAGRFSGLCEASITTDPIIDLYHQASISAAKATVLAEAYLLKNNGEKVTISGSSLINVNGRRRFYPKFSLLCEGNISCAIGRMNASVIKVSASAVVNHADAIIKHGAVANPYGSASALASMVSNPRARAIEKRTLVLHEENRVIYVKNQDRTITLSAS